MAEDAAIREVVAAFDDIEPDDMTGEPHLDRLRTAIDALRCRARPPAPPAPAERVTAEELDEIKRLVAAWKHPPVGRKDEARSGIPERLGHLATKLAKALEDENGRHADTAAMLLVERREKERLAAEVSALRAEGDKVRRIAQRAEQERALVAGEREALTRSLEALQAERDAWPVEVVALRSNLSSVAEQLRSEKAATAALRAEIAERNKVGEEVMQHFLTTPLTDEDPEVVRLWAEQKAIGDALDEAGIGVRGPEDTLLGRARRLIADANAEGEKLEALRAAARAVCADAEQTGSGLVSLVYTDKIDALATEIEEP